MARVKSTTPPEVSSTFFDRQEGRLLLGADEDSMIAEGVNIYDILPLSAALIDQTIDTTGYEKLACNDWSEDDYKQYAQWLSTFVETATPNRETYQQAYALGIGPHPKRIKLRFGSLWNFHDEAGLEGGFCRGKYSEWTNRDFIEYGYDVVKKRGGKKPNESTLQRHFRNRDGPSPSLIAKRFGNLRHFQEHLGFPDIHSWDKDDYIDYGVKVSVANGIDRPSRTVFDTLSQRNRGPSARGIINHFGKISTFQDAVEAERETREILDAEVSSERASQRWNMIEDGTVPHALFAHNGPHDVTSFLQQTARYLLVTEALHESYPQAEKIHIARLQPKSIINALRVRGTSLSAAELEVWAESNGLFDDIWPDDAYLTNLKVRR